MDPDAGDTQANVGQISGRAVLAVAVAAPPEFLAVTVQVIVPGNHLSCSRSSCELPNPVPLRDQDNATDVAPSHWPGLHVSLPPRTALPLIRGGDFRVGVGSEGGNSRARDAERVARAPVLEMAVTVHWTSFAVTYHLSWTLILGPLPTTTPLTSQV